MIEAPVLALSEEDQDTYFLETQRARERHEAALCLREILTVYVALYAHVNLKGLIDLFELLGPFVCDKNWLTDLNVPHDELDSEVAKKLERVQKRKAFKNFVYQQNPDPTVDLKEELMPLTLLHVHILHQVITNVLNMSAYYQSPD